MAPVSDVEREGDGSRSLSREDCLCPICLEIFMEPVTLPCTHTFCKVCFLESVDKATLCCPLCRKRVAVWARQHSRTKSLVNEALWTRIQAAFPRHRPQEDDYEPVWCPRLSEPGALRREYEDQVSKLTEEKRELDEQERRASEELIQRLLAEEEQLLRDQQRLHQEDEKLARILSRELNSVPDSDQSQVPEPAAVKKPTGMHRFLFPVSRSPAHSSMSNKENVLQPSDPPPLDYYGPRTDQSQPGEPHIGQSQPEETHSNQSQPEEPQAEEMDQSQLTDRPAEGGTKRKSPEEEAESPKRSCQSSCLLGVAMGEWEAELQRRRKQEEEDLRLALQLQQELNRPQPTNRRKGSADAYLLRGPTARTASETTTRTTSAPPAPRRPPSSTVTLSSMLNQTPAACSSPSTGTTSSEPGPLSPKPLAALATPRTDKRGATWPKADHKSPQTAKSKRQTTLTDLFNRRS